MLSFLPSHSASPLNLLPDAQISEAQTVADYCREKLDLNRAASGDTAAHAHLPLSILEAVWSSGVRPETVQNVVARYAEYAGLNTEEAEETAPAHTVADFLQTIERVGVENFAESVLQNRQRTAASASGILKAEAAYRFAQALNAHRAQTVPDVPAQLRGNAVFERAVLAIPGQSSGLSLQHFFRLCGAHDLAKPDRRVLVFLQAALDRPVTNAAEAQSLLSRACFLLQTDFPGLSPRTLDKAIWQQERGEKRQDKSKSAAKPPPQIAPPAPVDRAQSTEPVVPAAAPAPIVSPVVPCEAKTGEEEITASAVASYRVRLREIPADDRPRERLIQYGADVLSLGELLAILLRSGTQQQNVMELANHLLSQHGGLRGVAGLSVHELSEIHGIGPAKAAQIKAAIEFGRRLVAASPEERTKISSPHDVYNQVGPALRDENREHFIALLLDTKNGLLRQITISVGDLSSSLVHPREVFAPAVRYSAASLIVAHNHPSGDPSPSPEDVQVTARLVEAGELLGIALLDHIVVGDLKWVSLKEKGLM